MRRRAAVFVASDILAVYLAGTAFVPDPKWVAFYFYPLLSLEATLAAGTLAGLLVTGMSVIVYLAQLSLHISMLNEVRMPQVIAALGLLSTTGAFMAISGGLAERGRRDLRVLLDLAQALVRERDPASAIGLLDQRVHDALGGRVRSIALRQPDGHMQLLRWSTGERRVLTRAQAASGLGDTAALDAQFAAGTSFTYETDAWSVVTSALGLPEWARAVTMVPISLEGRWIGVIPVLWATPRVPDRHELRLLYGIANQVGPALAQAGLLPSEGPGEPAEAAASDPPPDPSPDSVSDPAAARSQAVRGG
jgi:hypothetical protein